MTFPRYLVAGVINTSTTYLLYLGLVLFLPYLLSYTISYIFGICLGYLLNSKWVFGKAPSVKTAIQYQFVLIANYVFGVFLLWNLVAIADISKEIAPLLIVVASVPVTYILNKLIFQR